MKQFDDNTKSYTHTSFTRCSFVVVKQCTHVLACVIVRAELACRLSAELAECFCMKIEISTRSKIEAVADVLVCDDHVDNVRVLDSRTHVTVSGRYDEDAACQRTAKVQYCGQWDTTDDDDEDD